MPIRTYWIQLNKVRSIKILTIIIKILERGGKKLPSNKLIIEYEELYDREVSLIHAFGLLIEKKVEHNYLEKSIKIPIINKGKLNLLTAILNKNFHKNSFIFIDDEDELTKLIEKI